MSLASLLPPDVPASFAAVLVVTSFFTSALTAALGLGGGVAMLAIMALGLPLTTLVPVHGIVQVGSNASRTIVQFSFVHWQIVLWFTIGAAAGTLAGVPVVTLIPEGLGKIMLAGFVVWSVFRPKAVAEQISRITFVVGGLASSAVGMVVGATGPLVAALIAGQGLTKQPLIATHATCMVAQHGLKILAFGAVGFAFAAWLPLLALMIAMGFLGTLAGTLFLDHLPEKIFRIAFRTTMVLISAQLVWEGLRSLFG
jgi:uncharacterized protein